MRDRSSLRFNYRSGPELSVVCVLYYALTNLSLVVDQLGRVGTVSLLPDQLGETVMGGCKLMMCIASIDAFRVLVHVSMHCM